VRSINVMFPDKTVRRLKEDEAVPLVEAGKASYISNTLFKAIEVGISIDAIQDRRDDKAIKLQIQAVVRKNPRKVVEPVVQEETQEPRLSKHERRQQRKAAEKGATT